MAPEQASGRPRFDVLVLGLIVYELLTGVLRTWPFDWRGFSPGPRSSDSLHADARAGFTTPIELRLEASETRGGCLVLEVEGRDRVPLAASLSALARPGGSR